MTKLLLYCTCLFFTVVSLNAQYTAVMPADSSDFPLTLSIDDADGNFTSLAVGSPQNYGPTVNSTVTAEIAWGYTAAGDTIGCEPIVTDLTGKWALIRRGVCNFTLKAYYAQVQGAVGCLICNDDREGAPGATVSMSGGDSLGAIAIPTAFISNRDCRRITDRLDNGMTVNAELAPISIWGSRPYHYPVVPEAQATQDFSFPSYKYFNYSTTDSIFTGSVSLTTPDGTTTLLATDVDTLAPQSYGTFLFDVTYNLDQGAGDYFFTFESDLPGTNAHVQKVTVTESSYQTHLSPAHLGQIQLTDQAYADRGNNIRWGMSVSPATTTEATSMNVAVCNVASLTGPNAAGSYLEAYIIDTDADDNGFHDVVSATSMDDFPDENIIAFGEYELSGNELCSENPAEMIAITLENPDDGSTPVMRADKDYIIYVEFGSTSSTGAVVPAIMSGQVLTEGSNLSDSARVFTRILETTNIFSGFFLHGSISGNVASPSVDYASISPFMRLNTGETIGTREPLLSGQLAMLPNPASDVATLQYSVGQPLSNARMELYSAVGQLVSTRVLDNSRSGSVEFDVRNLPSGAYFIRLTSDQGVRSLQIQVQH